MRVCGAETKTALLGLAVETRRHEFGPSGADDASGIFPLGAKGARLWRQRRFRQGRAQRGLRTLDGARSVRSSMRCKTTRRLAPHVSPARRGGRAAPFRLPGRVTDACQRGAHGLGRVDHLPGFRFADGELSMAVKKCR